MTRSLIALLALVSATGCAPPPGSFCDLYLRLDMTREGATALVMADRPAAERAAANEDTAAACPSADGS